MLGVITVVVVTVIFLISELPRDRPESTPVTPPSQATATRTKRSETGKSDECLDYYGGIELDYVKGSAASYTFDPCAVIKCKGLNSSWRGYDVWVGYNPMVDIEYNNQKLGYPYHIYWMGPCEYWSTIVEYSGMWRHYKDTTWQKLGFQRDFSAGQNPLTPSLNRWHDTVWPARSVVYLFIGVDVSGKDPYGLVKINFRDFAPDVTEIIVLTPPPPLSLSELGPQILEVDYARLKPKQFILMAIGYRESNLWPDWLLQNAREQNVSDCVACAAACPHLFTEPAPLYPEDQWGFECMPRLTREAASEGNCTTLASLFTPIGNDTVLGPFTPRKANYTCFNFTVSFPDRHEHEVREINADWCTVTYLARGKVSKGTGTEIGLWARAGLYYYCGGYRLYVRIPSGTSGLCAMVRLGAPLVLAGEKGVRLAKPGTAQLTAKRRRHVLAKQSPGLFDLTIGSPTYIDAIGVSRGVPNEFKVVDQIAGGFENCPIISGLFAVTQNNNVDRINYVYYNALRLANLTRDAVEWLAEQLGPTSLMAVQNRMTLDMLLGEKRGRLRDVWGYVLYFY